MEKEIYNRFIFRFLWVLNSLAIVAASIQMVITSVPPDSWACSDFLINYQGGFVRRGLLGELLYQFSSYFSCDARYVIFPLSAACFVCYLGVVSFISKKMQLSYFAFPTLFFCLGGDIIRKDYLIIVLVFLAVWLYKRVSNSHLRYIAVTLLLVIALNLHEVTFFIAAPLYFFVIFSDKETVFSLPEKLLHSFVLMGTMALVCCAKGTTETAMTVAHSWQFCYPEAFADFSEKTSIGALSWPLKDAIRFHLYTNFVSGDIPYAGCILRPVSVLIVLYVMLRVTLMKYWDEKNLIVSKYIYLATTHFIVLLPLFTILHCDFRRMVFYWTSISIISLYFLRDKTIPGMDFPVCRACIEKIRKWMALPQSKTLPFLLILLFSIPNTGNSLVSYGPPMIKFAVRLHQLQWDEYLRLFIASL